MERVASPGLQEGYNRCQETRQKGIKSRGQFKASLRETAPTADVCLWEKEVPGVQKHSGKTCRGAWTWADTWMLERIWERGTYGQGEGSAWRRLEDQTVGPLRTRRKTFSHYGWPLNKAGLNRAGPLTSGYFSTVNTSGWHGPRLVKFEELQDTEGRL